MKTLMQVGGIVCVRSENDFIDAIKSIKGVSDVSIDCESGIITIVSKKKIDKELLEDIISEAGFSILRINQINNK